MSTDGPGRDDLRIGDAERESAMQALGEHMSAGRLDIDEFGDRSAKVTAARTRAELSALFTDLPAPHPRYGDEPVPLAGGGPATSAGTAQSGGMQSGGEVADRPVGGVAQRLGAGLASVTGLIWIGTIIAIANTGLGWLIFIPIALSICVGSAWGRSRHDYGRRYRGRDERRRRHWD